MAVRHAPGRAPRSLILVLLGALIAVLTVVVSAAPPATASGTGGVYTPLTPTRILDTRWHSSVAAHATRHVRVLGQGGVPTTDVEAVAVTLTIPTPAQSGYVTAFATGTGRPRTSNVSFATGKTTAVSAVVALGADGFDLYSGSNGAIDVIADVQGYYAADGSAAPGAYVPVAPTRMLDTRSGLGAAKGAVHAHRSVLLQVGGRGGVPATGAGSVAVTVTATGGTANGYVTAFAAGTPRPGTSNLSFAARSTTANLVVATVGSDGKLALYNGSSGTVHLIADLVGYYRAGAATAPGQFAPVTPRRILDTRSGLGAPRGPLTPYKTLTLSVVGTAGVPSYAVGAVVLDITVTHPTRGGNLGLSWGTSFLNFDPQDTRADLVVAKLAGDGTIAVNNVSAGTSDVIADIAGYYLTGPSITGVSPAGRSVSGAQLITISGFGFTPDAVVMLGDVRAAESRLVNPGEMAVTAPEHSPVLVDVTVTTGYGVSAITPADRYYFFGPPHPLDWSAETTLDPTRGSVHAVSCPAVDFCAALDDYGYVTTFDGSQWSAPAQIGSFGSGVGAISCATAASCLAVGYDGESAVLTDGAWSGAVPIPGGGAPGVLLSCPETSFCVAGRRAGDTLYTYDGAAWSVSAHVDGLFGLSCPSASFCVATDRAGDAMTFDGSRWGAPTAIDAGQILALLSCPSRMFCMALDGAAGGPNVLSFDGTAWHRAKLPDGVTSAASAVSCSSPTFCMVVDGSSRSLTYDGTSWSAPTALPFYADYSGNASLSCAGSTLCVLARGGWATAVYAEHEWSLAQFDAPQGGLDSVSCVSSHFCAAADVHGNVMTTDGATWSALTDTGVHDYDVNGVSCVSPAFCMFAHGRRIMRYDGAAWSLVGLPNLYGGQDSVSCFSATRCVVVDALTRSSAFDGTGWSEAVQIRKFFSSFDQPSVSCPSATFCAVLFIDGVVLRQTNGTWARSNSGLAHATQLSCTSRTFCMAISADGMVSRYDGRRWSTPTPLGAANAHVSCTSSTHCIVAGTKSLVWDGSAWSGPEPVPDVASGPISCVSDSWCTALTQSGARTVTDP